MLTLTYMHHLKHVCNLNAQPRVFSRHDIGSTALGQVIVFGHRNQSLIVQNLWYWWNPAIKNLSYSLQRHRGGELNARSQQIFQWAIVHDKTQESRSSLLFLFLLSFFSLLRPCSHVASSPLLACLPSPLSICMLAFYVVSSLASHLSWTVGICTCITSVLSPLAQTKALFVALG